MANDIKIGDTVRLRSGGPLMTVRAASKTHASGWDCQWFAHGDEANLYERVFSSEVIGIVKLPLL